ncbi:MAG: hypothetical protein PHO27_10970 [Sulfuricurvum sp.]|nr:hypothetical protein [Sulfuricurvum sp.]
MKLQFNKQYYSIYLVAGIITACFIFMFISTVAVLKNIGGGKTSADIALENAKQSCDRKNGELVHMNRNNPLNTLCFVDAHKIHSQN